MLHWVPMPHRSQDLLAVVRRWHPEGMQDVINTPAMICLPHCHQAFTAAPLQQGTDPTAYRAARDDPIEEEEEEYVSNLCQCLCSCLMRPENKSKFLEVSGAGVLRGS